MQQVLDWVENLEKSAKNGNQISTPYMRTLKKRKKKKNHKNNKFAFTKVTTLKEHLKKKDSKKY